MELRSCPGGGRIVDAGSGRIVAADSQDDRIGVYRLDVSRTDVRRYRLLRPPFDPMAFTLRWQSQTGRFWLKTDAHEGALEPGECLYLSRTLRPAISPSDATVAGPGVHPYGPDIRIEQAWLAHDLTVSRPLFHTRTVYVGEGDLARAGDTWPDRAITLAPRYGPFSYLWFDRLLGVALAAALAWLLLVGLPRRRVHRALMARERALALLLEGLPPVGADGWLGRALATDTGESFVLLKMLGQGGFGAVFEAASGAIERPADERFAIKVVGGRRGDDGFRERFLREIKACASVHHAGVVKIFDWGASESESAVYGFMVMELVAGATLRVHLRRCPGGLPWQEASRLVAEVARALRAVHAAGLVHRDLKPENVMVTPAGHCKLLDFGVARHLLAPSLTMAGALMGTHGYMSPEQYDGKSSPASDIYALGVVYYELLCGQLPFTARGVWELAGQVMMTDPPPISHRAPDLPQPVQRLVMGMIAREPGKRPPGAEAIVAALEGILASAST